jgi:hypothetical protein
MITERDARLARHEALHTVATYHNRSGRRPECLRRVEADPAMRSVSVVVGLVVVEQRDQVSSADHDYEV